MPDRSQPNSHRLVWLDLARGLAVLSMVVAHFYPATGGQFDLSEYLTAPLFAFILGASVWLGWERHGHSTGQYLSDQVWRGLLLIVIGVSLQRVPVGIDVVLEELGILAIVLSVVLTLSRGRWVGPALLGGLAFAASPPLLHLLRTHSWGTARQWEVTVMQSLVMGQHYRVTTFLVFGVAGLLFMAAITARSPRAWQALVGSAVAAAAALAVASLGRSGPARWRPYSGSWLEQVGAPLLCASASLGLIWASELLNHRFGARCLSPVVALGRAALTAYVVQVLVAHVLIIWLHWPSPSWRVMVVVGLSCVVAAWAMMAAWGTGAVEWLLRLPGRLSRRVTRPMPSGVS